METGIRVCFVTHQCQNEGAERSLLAIIDRCIDQGLEVSVVCRVGGPFYRELGDRGIDRLMVSYPWWTTVNSDGDLRTAVRESIAAAHTIAGFLAEKGADVVYTNTAVVSAGAIAASLRGLPHIWHIRELANASKGLRFLADFRDLASFVASTSNRVVFNSKTLREDWGAGVPDGLACVIPNRVPVPRLSSPGRPLNEPSESKTDGQGARLCVVGTVVPLKGQMDAVCAVAELAKRQRPVRLDIVGPSGDDDYQQALVAAAERGGVSDRIAFHGYSDAPSEFVSACDIALMCSAADSWGRTTIEAMHVGKPMIGARAGGTVELIEHGVTGLLYTPGDPVDLADQIVRYLDAPDERSTIARAGQSFAAQFDDVESTTQRVVQLIRDVGSEAAQAVGLTRLLALAAPERAPIPLATRIRRGIRRLRGTVRGRSPK